MTLICPGRDGCRGRHREAIPEVTRDLVQPNHERLVILRLQPDYRSRVFRIVVEAADRRELPRITGLRISDSSLSLQGPNDVKGDDRRVLERRGVPQPVLEMEGPGQPVRRDLRRAVSQIRVELYTALLRRLAVIRVEGSEEAATCELPGSIRVGLRVQVDGRGFGVGHGHAQGP